MIKAIYIKALEVLKKKPLHLWGISLLSTFLGSVCMVAFGIIPILGVIVSLVLGVGMTMVYLAGYRGEGIETENLFVGFKRENFGRIAGGMAWMYMWIIIWGLIPIVGPVFAVIKTYEYSFTPYILMTRPEIKTLDAIKVSKAETEGYKGKMFLASFMFGVAVSVVSLVLGLLGLIPFLGILFILALIVFSIAVVAFGPLFLGLVNAAFYDEIQHCIADPSYKKQYEKVVAAPVQQSAQPASFCSKCGVKVSEDAAFCPACGNKLND